MLQTNIETRDFPAVRQTVMGMRQLAHSLQIVDNEGFKAATILWKQAKDWKKAIDHQRKNIIEPDRKRINLVNDKAKELTDPLDDIIETVKAKTDVYQRQLEASHVRQVAAAATDAAIVGSEDTLYIPEPEKALRGEGAVAYTKVEKAYRVVDISLVPVKYLQVNDAAVKADLKLGISDISGLEIFTENKTILRSR